MDPATHVPLPPQFKPPHCPHFWIVPPTAAVVEEVVVRGVVEGVVVRGVVEGVVVRGVVVGLLSGVVQIVVEVIHVVVGDGVSLIMVVVDAVVVLVVVEDGGTTTPPGPATDVVKEPFSM